MSSELVKKGKSIFRFLKINGDKCLIIDCVKRSLPYWTNLDSFDDWERIDDNTLLEILNIMFPPISDLSQEQLRTMHSRYGSISSSLISISDESERRIAVHRASLEYGVSKQTIRHRLCDYLVFQNIIALAPISKKRKDLSHDEKNFRWALNKYFYCSKI